MGGEVEDPVQSSEDEYDAARYHPDGMAATRTKMKRSKAKSLHLASTSVVKNIFSILKALARFVHKTPTSCDDNLAATNDIIIVQLRNIEWTKVGTVGDRRMHPLKGENRFIVRVFGRTKKQIQWILSHLHKGQCSALYPDESRSGALEFTCRGISSLHKQRL